MTTTARKFDIFEVLSALDSQNVNYFTSLSDADKKKIPLFVVQRWFSGTRDELQLLLINECVNPYMFSLQQHPSLLWMLLTAASSGVPRRYSWIKLPSHDVDGTKKVVTELVMHRAYGYSAAETRDVMSMLTYDSVFQLAEYVGTQPDELTELAKEWGIAVPRKKRATKAQPSAAGEDAAPTYNVLDAFEM